MKKAKKTSPSDTADFGFIKEDMDFDFIKKMEDMDFDFLKETEDMDFDFLKETEDMDFDFLNPSDIEDVTLWKKRKKRNYKKSERCLNDKHFGLKNQKRENAGKQGRANGN